MKRQFFWGTFFCTAALFGIDPGGVSVDLAVLKGNAASASGAENMLKSGDFETPALDLAKRDSVWTGGCWVWQKGTRDQAHREEIGKATRRSIAEKTGVNNSRALHLESAESIQKLRTADGEPMMANSATQTIGIPDSDAPVKYQITFQVRGKTFPAAGLNSLRVFVECYDKAPGERGYKLLRPAVNHAVTLPKHYESRALSFVAPPHTLRIDLRFALYGLGDVFIDNVKMFKAPVMEKANIYVTPWSYLDNTYCIGEKQPASIVFVMQNEGGEKFKALRLNVKIPAGFKLIGSNESTVPVSEKKNQDGSVSAVFNVQAFVGGMPKDGHGMWRKPALMLESALPVSDKTYALEYSLSDGDWQSSVKKLNLKVIEPLNGATPKRFVSGFQTTHEFNVEGAAALKFRDFFVRSGINAIHGGSSQTLKKALKESGIARYSQPHYLCNGYRIGTDNNRTEESYFRQVDGKPFKRSNFKTCPVEVYNRGAFYRSEVLPMLEKLLVTDDATDQIMPNWEPYYLDYKGCFCDRCREEFVKHMAGKAKPEEVRANWPKNIVAAYGTEWPKFRSIQHGKLCVTLERDIHALGKKAGKESHFMPEIAWSQLIEAEKSHFAQYSPLDYMDKLPWLEPWGPYIFSSFTEKYDYYPGIHLITFIAAGDMKKFVEKHIPPTARRPQLIALPQGFQCGTWVTEPEAFSFEVLCFFLNRWEGALGYYFPQGYDHRYWNAFAAANKLIAQYENIVFDGKSIDSRVKVTAKTALPQPFFPAYWSEGGNFKKKLPGLEKATMLQAKSFELGQNILVAVGNFWQKGDAFFTLRISGLKPDAQYFVSSSEGFGMGSFSGAQLQRGILAHVGALRWNFLLVTPDQQTKENLSQDDIRQLYRQRLPEIERAFRAEADYARTVQDEVAADNPVNDFKAVYELNSADVNLKAVKENDQDYIQIQSSLYTALLDPAAGGSLVSLKAAGKDLVHRQPGFGFGLDAFWYPGKVAFTVMKGFKITGMDKVPNGVKVELTRTIGIREKSTLAGLRITKTFLFTRNSVTVTSALNNTSAAPLTFAFRYHTLPAHLADAKGVAEFGDHVKFERELALKIARFGAPDKHLDKAYSVSKFLDSKVPELELKAEGLPKVKVTFPGRKPYGVIFWDGGKFSTLEPLYNTEKLAPGATADYSTTWSL